MNKTKLNSMPPATVSALGFRISACFRPSTFGVQTYLTLALLLAFAPCVRADSGTNADLSKSLGDTQRGKEREYVRRTDAAMDHWRSNRFGIMIHWGVYAIPGGCWQGKEVKSAAEWVKVGGISRKPIMMPCCRSSIRPTMTPRPGPGSSKQRARSML